MFTYTIVDRLNSSFIWEKDISLATLYEKLSKPHAYYGYIRTNFLDIPLEIFIDLYMLDKRRISLIYFHKYYQTYEICLAAVKRDGGELYWVQNQTYDICVEAVKNDGSAIWYVKGEITPELCRLAIEQNPIGLFTYRHKLEQIIYNEEVLMKKND